MKVEVTMPPERRLRYRAKQGRWEEYRVRAPFRSLYLRVAELAAQGLGDEQVAAVVGLKTRQVTNTRKVAQIPCGRRAGRPSSRRAST